MSTQGGQSLSDFVIDMRVCVRCHSTEQQSQKHQRVAERQLFLAPKVSIGFTRR